MNGGAGPALAVLVTLVCLRGALLGARRVRVRARVVPTAGPPAAKPAPSWLTRALDDCGLEVDPQVVWLGCRCGPVVAVMAGVLAGPVLGGLVLAALTAGPLLAASTMRGRGDRRRAAAVAPFLEAVAGSLRSGATVVVAVREAASRPPAPLAGDLADLARRLDAGDRLADGLAAWAAARPLAEVRLATAALRLAADAGGRSAQAVDGVAATVRSRTAVAAEARALGTQARYSAWVIAGAPLVFAVVAAAADPRSAAFLTGTPLGLAFLATGLLLDGVGCWWMARITARAS